MDENILSPAVKNLNLQSSQTAWPHATYLTIIVFLKYIHIGVLGTDELLKV